MYLSCIFIAVFSLLVTQETQEPKAAGKLRDAVADRLEKRMDADKQVVTGVVSELRDRINQFDTARRNQESVLKRMKARLEESSKNREQLWGELRSANKSRLEIVSRLQEAMEERKRLRKENGSLLERIQKREGLGVALSKRLMKIAICISVALFILAFTVSHLYLKIRKLLP